MIDWLKAATQARKQAAKLCLAADSTLQVRAGQLLIAAERFELEAVRQAQMPEPANVPKSETTGPPDPSPSGIESFP